MRKSYKPLSAAQQRQPVLIAGAGPVGLTAALELARHGVPSTILEQLPGLRNMGSRGIVLERASLEVFERVRALEILQRGLVPSRRRTFFGDQELFNMPFQQPGADELPRFVNLQQDHTERILLEEAQRRSELIDIRWNHEIIGLEQDDAGVRLTVRNGKRDEVFSSPFAMACDGCRSGLRKLLGADFPGYTDGSSFLIADVKGDLADEKEHHFTFRPANGEAQTQLVVPQPDGIWRIDWQLFEGQDPDIELREASLKERLARTLPEGRSAAVVWSSCYRFHQRIMDAFVHGRVLFVGDSAHLVAPFGARGMNSGIQDAENAAWKIAAAMRGLSPAEIVATYDAERRAAGLENQHVTRRTMAFISPATGEEREVRDDILRRSVDDPVARSAVDSGRMSEPFHYKDSPLLQPGHPLVGRRVPDLVSDCGKRLRRIMELKPMVLGRRKLSGVSGAHAAVISAKEAVEALPGWAESDVVILRPDGHIGAVTPENGAAAAVRRIMGHDLQA